MFRIFMDAVVGWVLDVSLSEQQTCAIYIFFQIMFIVTAVGWVLDVILYEEQKHVLYMLIMFMDAAVGWFLDVRLSEQETCATLSYFLQRHCWILGCSF
jgi:hypothetical protein